MKRSPALLTFLAVCKRLNGRPSLYEPNDTEVSTWIEIAQNVTELSNDEIFGEAGLYRLAAQYYLDFQHYRNYQQELQREYDEVYS